MDVISYVLATQVSKDEKDTRENTLGVGIEGTFPHARGRIDKIEEVVQGVVTKANKLIVNDTINIMKANAKFNIVAATARYKHQNMVFEDFLDATGIDAAKSSGYTLDVAGGLVKASGVSPYTIVTTAETASASPEKAVLVVEESPLGIQGTYSLSRDNGVTFEPITPETLFYFTGKSPAGTQLRLKAELPANVQLLNYGLTWS